MDKPELTPEEQKVVAEMLALIKPFQPERRREIIVFLTAEFREDIRSKVLGLQAEAERLSKII